jgi:DNA-binding NtrC family response regulator
VVILRPPAFSQRQAEHMLNEALRLGAFSVLEKPVDLEQLLAVFRRLIDRRYRGAWPGRGDEGPQPCEWTDQ